MWSPVWSWIDGGGDGGEGDADGKGAAHAGGTGDIDPAVVSGDGVVDGGEAEPGAALRPLGCEERLEDVQEGARRHAAAGVGDGEAGPGAGLRLRWRAVAFVSRLESEGAHGEGAALRHGIAGIDAKVHHDLLDHDEVGDDGQWGGFGGEGQADATAEEVPEHFFHVEEGLAEIDGLHAGGLFAAEQEKLPGEFSAVTDFGFQLFELAAQGRADLGVRLQEVEVEGERGKGVVEIVGDAAGELAENLGALGLLNLFGEALLLGDVFEAEEDLVFTVAGDGRGRNEQDGVARGIAWLRDFEVELGSVGGAALAGIVEGALEKLG